MSTFHKILARALRLVVLLTFAATAMDAQVVWVNVAYPSSGTATTRAVPDGFSLLGSGSLAFTAGGSNKSITITPSGSGQTRIASHTLLAGLLVDGAAVVQFPAGAADKTSGLEFAADSWLFRKTSGQGTWQSANGAAVLWEVAASVSGADATFLANSLSGGVGYFGVAGTANNIITGSVAGTLAIRAPGNMMFGTNNGTLALTLSAAQVATFVGAVGAPSFSTPSGGANTGNFTVSGKTSGTFVITTADATAQAITLKAAAQTVGAGTLNISDLGGTSDTVVTLAQTQTLLNKTLTSPTISNPAMSGTATLSGGAATIDASSGDGTISATGGGKWIVSSTLKVAAGLADNAASLGTSSQVPVSDGTKITWTTKTCLIPFVIVFGSGTPATNTYYNGSNQGFAWSGLLNSGRYRIAIPNTGTIVSIGATYFASGGTNDTTHAVAVDAYYDSTTAVTGPTFFMNGTTANGTVVPTSTVSQAVTKDHYIEARVTYPASFSGPTGVTMVVTIVIAVNI